MSEAMTVNDQAALRDLVGPTAALSVNKEMPRLDAHCRHFITLCPFLCLGTMSADGKADVSPRGDPPGFVKVLDDRTLLIPERPGNRRVDSLSNILARPSVGLLFLVPGIEETLRVNGRATIVTDPGLLGELAISGKVPRLGIRVEIDEVFFHCAKALKRSRLWDPAAQIDRQAFPPYAEIIRDQRRPGEAVEPIEAAVRDSYQNQLY